MKNKIRALTAVVFAAVIIMVMTSCVEEIFPPTGVTATKYPNENKIHITWNASTGAAAYDISYKTNMDSGSTRTFIQTVTNTTHIYSYYDSTFGDLIDTLEFFVKAKSSQYSSDSQYKESGWARSNPVSIK